MHWMAWSVGMAALAGAGSLTGVSSPPRVMTSCLPVYCLTRNIAGDAAQVDLLLTAGMEAHDFQLTRRQRGMLDQADLIVVNGLGMEPWLAALRRSEPGRRIIEATAGVVTLPAHPGDPHVWLDPQLACAMVTNILLGLQATDPARAGTYSSNAAAFLVRLEALDHELRAELRPCRGQGLVTQHNAFAYFARHYDLKLVGVVEESPDIAPSPRHLSTLRQAILDNQVRVIFVEPQHPSKLARQMARDLGLSVAALDTLESGRPDPGAYEVGMRRNARTLRQYLK